MIACNGALSRELLGPVRSIFSIWFHTKSAKGSQVYFHKILKINDVKFNNKKLSIEV